MPRLRAPAAGDVGEEHGGGGPPREVERERDAHEPEPEPGDEEPADEDVDGERGGTQEHPTRRWVVCSVRLRVKMEKETGSRGNMDIFVDRSHLSGFFSCYLLTAYGRKDTEVKKISVRTYWCE